MRTIVVPGVRLMNSKPGPQELNEETHTAESPTAVYIVSCFWANVKDRWPKDSAQ
jgi:hypothetical protein